MKGGFVWRAAFGRMRWAEGRRGKGRKEEQRDARMICVRKGATHMSRSVRTVLLPVRRGRRPLRG